MSPKAPTNFVIFERNLKKWPRSFALVIPVGRETLNQQGTRLQDAYGTRIDRFSVTSRTMTTDSIGSKQMDASGRNILSLCVYGVEVEGSKNADSGLHSHSTVQSCRSTKYTWGPPNLLEPWQNELYELLGLLNPDPKPNSTNRMRPKCNHSTIGRFGYT